MKKIIFVICVIVGNFYNFSNATHLFRNNAANINTGILPNERIDKSSITARGQLSDGTQNLSISSMTTNGIGTSTITFRDASFFVSTLTIGSQLSSLGVSSNTYNLFITSAGSMIDSLSRSTQAFDLFDDTASSRLNGLATSTTSAQSQLNQLIIFTSNTHATSFRSISAFDEGSFQGMASSINVTGGGASLTIVGGTLTINVSDFNLFVTSAGSMIDSLSRSTQAFALFEDTANSRLNGLATSTTSIQNQVNQLVIFTTNTSPTGFRPVSAYDEGTFQGMISSINVTGAAISASVSGGTLTINNTGSESNSRYFEVVVGSLTAPSNTVDIASNTEDGLNAAIARIPRGGKIIYRAGTYTIRGVTIPAGVTVEGSSVTFIMGDTNRNMFYVMGELKDVSLNFNNIAVGTYAVLVGTLNTTSIQNAGRLTNVSILNQYRTPYPIVAVLKSSYAIIDVNLFNFTGSTEDAQNIVPNGMFYIKESSNVYIRIRDANGYNGYASGGLTSNIIAVMNAHNIFIENSKLSEIGGQFLTVADGCKNIVVKNNYFNLTNTVNAGGFGFIYSNPYPSAQLSTDISSSVIVQDNVFTLQNNINFDLITPLGRASSGIRAYFIIDGNTFINRTPTPTARFINVGNAQATNTLIQNNRTFNISTFLSDSGTGTDNASNNFKDAIAQGTAQ